MTLARQETPYPPVPGVFDEAVDEQGGWRAPGAVVLAEMAGQDLTALHDAVQASADSTGLCFASPGGSRAFIVDPVPRVLAAREWERLELGVAQRTRALDAFVDDVHGAQRCVSEGVIPARVIAGAEHHEPEAADVRPPAGVWIPIAGLDVIRGPDGDFRVLEDNVRTPSGIAYAMATRQLMVDAHGLPDPPPRPVDGAVALLAETLAAAAPPTVSGEPHVVVLSDGPESSAYWEHRELADALGAPLVTPDELTRRGRRVVRRVEPGRAIDVVYRRTDSSALDSPAGALLRGAVAAGTLGVVNAFGTGVADDKLVHAYVEDLIRLYLGEEPALASVRTLDLERDEHRTEALDRLEAMVIKPRGGSGGEGVTICAHADPEELEATRRLVRQRPGDYIAQELVQISTHPTVVDGRLAPRHVDLRPFVFLAPEGHARVLPGGLTRVALQEGSLVVNSSQDGGAKDTWVMP